jgi:hypothetical protein
MVRDVCFSLKLYGRYITAMQAVRYRWESEERHIGEMKDEVVKRQ